MPKNTAERTIDRRFGTTGGGGLLVGSATGTTIAAHALNSSTYHTGTLADSQAPQFAMLDGSRLFTGNIAFVGAQTVDGVDVSAHAANANAHHNQSHVLATTSALGGDHSVSGLTTGQVLRATGATTAAFGSVLWSEVNKTTSSIADITTKTHSLLTGLTGSDDHTQYVHNTIARSITAQHTFAPGSAQAPFLLSANAQGQTVVGLRADQLNRTVTAGAGLSGAGALTSDITVNMGTPSSISVATTNSASGTTHGHAVVSSSNPGANASLLASNSSGQLTLPLFVATTSVTAPSIVTASGDLAITPAGTNINLSTSKTLQSSNYVSGWAGSGYRIDSNVSVTGETFAEFDNLSIRGTLSIYELLINQIRATNGTLIVSSAGKIDSVSGSNWTLEDPEGSNVCPFAINDLVIIQNVDVDSTTLVKRIVRRVTAVSGKTITVTAVSGGPTDTGSAVAGDAVVRFGNSTNAARQGVVLITSDFANSPYIDIVSGVTSWADWTGGTKTKGRFGLLSGLSIGSANEYGIAAGDGFAASNSYFKVGTSGGLQNNIESTWAISGTPAVKINATHGMDILTYDKSGGVIPWGDQRMITWSQTLGAATPDGAIWTQRDTAYNDLEIAANYASSRVGHIALTAYGDSNHTFIDFLGSAGASPASVSVTSRSLLIDLGSGTAGTGKITAYANQLLLSDLTTGGADGSAASPLISFIEDTDTGIYRSAANQINISTGGTSRVTVNSTSFAVHQNADLPSYLGYAVVGYVGHAGYAAFAHKDQASTTGYTLLAHSGGDTYLNAATAKRIHFRNNNTEVMNMSDVGLRIGDATTPTEVLEVVGTIYASNRLVAGGADVSSNVSKFTGRYSTYSGISLTAASWGYASAVLFNAYQANNSVRLSASGGCKYLGAQYTGNVTAPGMFYYGANSNRFEWWIGEAGLANGADITAWAEQLRLDSAGKLTLFGDLEWSSGGFAAGWTALTYNTNWSSYGGAYGSVRYCKIGDWVLVNGMAKKAGGAGTATVTIGTLPSGYRPTTQKSWYTTLSVGSVEGAYKIEVTSGGNIAITLSTTSAIDYVSLDCIQFRVNS